MKRKQNKTHPDSLPKLVSFVGRSNSGKTTLLTKLIPLFKQLGFSVGMIKNTHHDVEFDKPGKDSWKYAQSGSDRILVSSGKKIAIFSQSDEKTTLYQLAERWFSDVDLVISEGFKNEDCFKIEVIRAANQKTPLFDNPKYQIDGIVSDINLKTSLPSFGFGDLDKIVHWICTSLELRKN